MPSSRRGAPSSSHRPLAVKGESASPRGSARSRPSFRTLDVHSSMSHQSAFSSAVDSFPHRSQMARTDFIPGLPSDINSTARPDPRDQNGLSQQRLPSLRTVIDLPPLQLPNESYPASQRSPTMAFPHTSRQGAHLQAASPDRSPTSGRQFSAPQPNGGLSVYYERADPRNRPIPPSPSRSLRMYGHPGTNISISSPHSETSVPVASFHDDRFRNPLVRPEINQPMSTFDNPSLSRRELSHRDAQHLSLVTDRRTSMAPAGPAVVPRCVGQEHVQGKGLCYIYEDGSYCEAIVRGEPVNPEWGLTRAGRARKRLAKACNSCREKKVKCEPGSNYRCQRCSRKGQDCLWSHYSESSPDRESYGIPVKDRSAPLAPESVYDSHYSPSRMPLTPPYTVSSKNSYEPVSLPELEPRHSSKRLRSHSPDGDDAESLLDRADRQDRCVGGEVPHDSGNGLVFAWEIDPYHIDPTRASKLLHLYFDYRDSSINCVLPRESFWHWVRGSSTRSRHETVLLYAVLALGSLFSTEPELRAGGVRYAHLARYAEKEIACQHSLSLALARLHLSFLHFATGDGAESCYFVHASFRTLHALQLNVQEGILNVPAEPAARELGLSHVELTECRRRVFWLGYLTERYCCFVSSITLLSNVEEDMFLHLPNSERHYQTGVDSVGPYFEGGLIERGPSCTGELGGMALSVGIASIWGDVVKQTYRATHRRTVTDYPRRYEMFYGNVLHRLGEWESSLPGHLQYSQTNTWRNIRCGDFSTYFVLQSVYHATALHLARFARFRDMSSDAIRRNIRHANTAARNLLSLVSALARSDINTGMGSCSDQAFAHPFCGYAIICACDIVSSAGNLDRHLRDADNSLKHAHTILRQIGRFFHTGTEQARQVEKRRKLLNAQHLSGGGKPTWRCSEPLAPTYVQKDFDVVYGIEEGLYHEAMADAGGWPDVRGAPGA